MSRWPKETWDPRWRAYLAYVRLEEKLELPEPYRPFPELPAWIRDRRRLAEAGTLSGDELACLRAIEAEHARYVRLRPAPRVPTTPYPIGPGTFAREKVEPMLAALRRFRSAHGHTRVPNRGKDGPDSKLANWVRRMRRSERDGILPAWVHRELDALGFEWEVPPGARDRERWEELFARLLRFQAEHGDCLVPIRIPQDPELTTWVRFQRVRARERRLDPERKRRLEEVGFAFNARDAIWERWYQRLVAFKREHGHCDVPFRNPGKLGNWIRRQRVAKKQRVLRPDRVRRLQALGVSWELRRPVDVDARVEELVAFRAKHGHLAVPQHRGMDALNAWMKSVRRQHARGTLERAVRQKLDAIGFPFEDEEVAWEQAFGAIASQVRRTGGLPRPGTLLGDWVKNQQRLRERGDLDPERERRLSALDI